MELDDDLFDLDSTQLGKKYEGWQGAIADFFKFDEYRTTFKTEILAGLTTFMTMSYILVVNPLILSKAIFLETPKDLFGELVFSTAVSAAIGTLLMALFAKYPFALAPGMGMNAFFTFSVVIGLKLDWRLALGCVFVEGIIFFLLTITDIRRHLITAIPDCIKTGTIAGIGLFLAYIGLGSNLNEGGAGLIVVSEATKTAFGSFRHPATLLAAFGIIMTVLFVSRRIKGAVLWGILGTAILGWILGIAKPPTSFIDFPVLPVHTFGQAFVGLGGVNANNFLDFLAAMLVFLFVDVFDNVGTLAGVSKQAGFINERGELPRANSALMADSIAAVAGSILGVSTVTTYVESAAGTSVGGRTGFTSVIVAILFLISLPFAPIFAAIPAFATTPALVVVGVLMMGSISNVRWDDFSEALPTFATLFFIPFGFSIAEGLSVGVILYVIMKLFRGRSSEISLVTWILALIFVARFVFVTMRFG
ncbi:permease [Synechococcus sp. PCC 7502]|uniref:NCS2 family permease n=1 Tax=Synechococcus sp. PCC 7502 TaxID=1173263 RepID=UPI00029FEF92|nr:NCS2 family permease [Synechococcus sp. PCC 7502]AFY73825.1 permease [Synechococcus sp. PCC 7502]